MRRIAERWPLAAFLAGVCLAGFLLARAYGESWDELKFYKYADSAMQAYVNWPGGGEIPVTGNTYDNYGPAYVMFVSLGARALGFVLPWTESDLRHVLYFFTYGAGVWALFALGRRWLSPVPALGAALLFAAQPLFWGHAFISPKDIPFLTFFLLSLVTGFRMVDSVEQPAGEAPAPPGTRRLALVTGVWLAFVLLSFSGTPVVRGMLEQAVRAAAAGQDTLIARLASDVRSADPEIYIQKFFTLFLLGRAILFWGSAAFLGWLYSRTRPSAFRFLGRILPSAIFLGLTICIRVLGPLAGLIVGLYAWSRLGKRSLGLLGVYAFAALAVMYATWPYLWPDPAGRFIESLVVMAQYPWRGQVLFDGILYESTAIPRAYLPVLLGIQLTEPVWALCAAGLTVTVLGAVRKRIESVQLLALTLLWFVLPALAFVALRSPLYDNFRQVFFILPPVFLMAGAAFEQVKKPLLQVALIALVVLPGVVDGIRLHPYEYIHYNRFIGGVEGAFRRFELDYWGISYREAAAYVNSAAPANGTVWIEGPAHLFQLYARPDLKTYSPYEPERAGRYDCAVSLTRYDLDLTSFPDAARVYEAGRQGAVLAVVKQPADGSCRPGRAD